jgi:hypothetical protein
MSILVLVGLLAAAFNLGLLVAWNNTKSSLKSKLDAEIGKATGAGQQALAAFKAKL